jgi:hypothetical protein
VSCSSPCVEGGEINQEGRVKGERGFPEDREYGRGWVLLNLPGAATRRSGVRLARPAPNLNLIRPSRFSTLRVSRKKAFIPHFKSTHGTRPTSNWLPGISKPFLIKEIDVFEKSEAK